MDQSDGELSRPCPECGAELVQGHREGLSTLECPNAHGAGINILEAYKHLQQDEVEAMWRGVESAPPSGKISPLTGKTMASVTFVVDSDVTYGNSGAGARFVTIEVDRETYFGWFSLEELTSMPFDRSGRGPGGVGLVGLDQLGESQGHRYDGVFERLTEADYQDGAGSGRLGALLSGLFGRIRR